MPKLIIEQDDGTKEEYTTFFAVVAIDKEGGADIRPIIGLDCRVLVAGAMLKKAIIHASDGWDEFVKNIFPNKGLIKPDDEALNKRIKWQLS